MKYLIPLALLALTQCKSDKQASGPPSAMPVQFAHPVSKTIAPTETFTGRFTPVEDVALQARVSGYLESVHFTEGKKVNKGDLMFRIDPRPFDAALSRAEALQKQAVARLGLAESNFKTAEKLVKNGAVSQEEFNTRESEVAQAKADVLAAEAGLRSAQLDRDFADIHAPIAGIAGSFHVTAGNFISGGNAGATLLTTIVPQSPIHCTFEIDERRALQFSRLFNGGEGKAADVEIAVSDGENFGYKGVIDFAENRLDPDTATLRLRAKVENADGLLTPGLFARVRVPAGDSAERLLIRDSSLGFDQDKRFAWLLGKDNTVTRKYVETGSLEGSMRIITGGLTVEDLVAVSGMQLLRPQVPVAPTTVPMIAEAAVRK